jgi:two-component system cell cycle response regulator DivK
MVVEADAHSLIAIGAILRELGIQYKRNTTGADVLGKLAAMSPQPNFILLDLDLPHGNAFDILNDLQSNAQLRRVPVIAIADSASPQVLDAVRKAGFTGFIAKPLPRRQFGEMVERILSGSPVWQVMV